jgi:hypothetical protein
MHFCSKHTETFSMLPGGSHTPSLYHCITCITAVISSGDEVANSVEQRSGKRQDCSVSPTC